MHIGDKMKGGYSKWKLLTGERSAGPDIPGGSTLGILKWSNLGIKTPGQAGNTLNRLIHDGRSSLPDSVSMWPQPFSNRTTTETG
jgi:hypothetical protein